MFLYVLIYLPWFTYLEQRPATTPPYMIHMKIDDFIPFSEYFIVPYLLWFLFIAAGVLYFFFKNTADFYKLTIFLFLGMTIFLIVSTVWPNGQMLRPTEFTRDNIFVELVKHLYSIDTPTNIAPSIHVYNTLCILIAFYKSEDMKKHKRIKAGSTVLGVLIILSTMFLKQHSAFDVITAFVMCAVLYVLVYRVDYAEVFARIKSQKVKKLFIKD